MPASENAKRIAQIAADAISEKLGTDILAIDLSDQMVLNEVLLISTGQNPKQVEAIADFVEEKMRLSDEKPAHREKSEEWVLLDYSDLVVHIQTENLRRYYALDRLWNDCPIIKLKVDEKR